MTGARGARPLVRAADLAGGYRPAPTRSATSPSARAAARSSRCSGPTAAARRTLFRALLGELPHRRGTVDLAGRPRTCPQTERARLDFPVSALDVALMGAYGRTPWYRRLSRSDRAAAAPRSTASGSPTEASERFGALSGGQRQRVLIARALVQDAPVLLLDEPLSGVDAVSAARIEALFAELRGEGRVLLVATHDVRQARAWHRVLCLNRAQVAFGPPADVLTTETLQAHLRRRARRARRRLDGGRRRAPRAPCTDTSTRPALDAHRPDHPAARCSRSCCSALALRPARRLGAAAPPGLRRGVAQPRDAARSRDRRARRRCRWCSAPPAACSSRPARSRSRPATRGSGPTSVSRSPSARWSGGHAARPGADSPPRLEELLFGDLLGATTADLVASGSLALAASPRSPSRTGP